MIVLSKADVPMQQAESFQENNRISNMMDRTMKAKKAAILMVSATLAMGTVGAVSVLADPPAMGGEQFGGGPGGQNFGGEMPQAPNGQMPNGQTTNASEGT